MAGWILARDKCLRFTIEIALPPGARRSDGPSAPSSIATQRENAAVGARPEKQLEDAQSSWKRARPGAAGGASARLQSRLDAVATPGGRPRQQPLSFKQVNPS
ncbi:uncharacterized protein IUM83_00104 [Phytophthora cinnamomi]|uniref:uncharacterized protein n=1 Tax=Phytophthora cinnamomi TaxID=4785 RepID=UPI00355A75F3|nr:hypothetical protein IUM83_00104 [Phytophthora cinnamomi]